MEDGRQFMHVLDISASAAHACCTGWERSPLLYIQRHEITCELACMSVFRTRPPTCAQTFLNGAISNCRSTPANGSGGEDGCVCMQDAVVHMPHPRQSCGVHTFTYEPCMSNISHCPKVCVIMRLCISCCESAMRIEGWNIECTAMYL